MQVLEGKLTAGELSTFIILALFVGGNIAGLASTIAQLVQASSAQSSCACVPCARTQVRHHAVDPSLADKLSTFIILAFFVGGNIAGLASTTAQLVQARVLQAGKGSPCLCARVRVRVQARHTCSV